MPSRLPNQLLLILLLVSGLSACGDFQITVAPTDIFPDLVVRRQVVAPTQLRYPEENRDILAQIQEAEAIEQARIEAFEEERSERDSTDNHEDSSSWLDFFKGPDIQPLEQHEQSMLPEELDISAEEAKRLYVETPKATMPAPIGIPSENNTLRTGLISVQPSIRRVESAQNDGSQSVVHTSNKGGNFPNLARIPEAPEDLLERTKQEHNTLKETQKEESKKELESIKPDEIKPLIKLDSKTPRSLREGYEPHHPTISIGLNHLVPHNLA